MLSTVGSRFGMLLFIDNKFTGPCENVFPRFMKKFEIYDAVHM